MLFYCSTLLSVFVSGTVRELVIMLDEERLARTNAEGHTRESEQRFCALADSAPSLMWVAAADRSRAFVNIAYTEFLGAPFEEALKFD